jgi:putative membrane protein
MFGGFLIRWLFNGIAIWVTTLLPIGISVPDTRTIIWAALVLGLVNASIRWLFILLTLPLSILTLGLFTLVINALMLFVVSAVVPGFQIANFWSAFVGALIIAIVSTSLSHLSRR